MGNILTFNSDFLDQDRNFKRLQIYCMVNVLILGLIYGCSAALFSNSLLAEKGLLSQGFNPVKIIVAGVPVAFFMHAGAALFIWVFLKAMGGKSDFITAYFYIGLASVSLWALAPFIAALQIGAASALLKGLALALSLYALGVIISVVRTAFRMSGLRMTFATLVTLIYISCFLYLWT
mgnify:CR=1 FL=1